MRSFFQNFHAHLNPSYVFTLHVTKFLVPFQQLSKMWIWLQEWKDLTNIKQIFHAFLFNIRNYSPDVINIQRRQAELNILTRVNSFDIKQKGMEYLFYYMPLCYQHKTRSLKIKPNKTHQFSVTAQVFFWKNSTTAPSKSFYITVVDIFLKIINPRKNQYNANFPNMKSKSHSRMTRDQARKHDSHLWC